VPTFNAAFQGFQQLGIAQPRQLVKSGYAPVLATWLVDGGEAKLMKDGDSFVVAIPAPNTGHRTYYQHPDLTILRAYLADVCGFSLPKIPKEKESAQF